MSEDRKGRAPALPAHGEIGDLADIIESSLNEIYVFGQDDFRFRYANRAARVNLGYSMEELEALTPLELKRELEPDAFFRLLAPLRTGRRPAVQFAARHVRKDGSDYPVDVWLSASTMAGVPVFTAIILDRTEAEVMTGRLARSETLLAKLTASVPDAIIAATLEGRTIVLANEATFEIFGYTPTELMGRSTRVFYRSDAEFDAFRRAVDEARSRGESRVRVEEQLVHKDGSEIYADVLASIVQQEGADDLVIGVARDITERRRVEDELRTSRDELRRLAAGLERARERERAYVAREIHDEFGQTLTSVDFELELLGTDPSPTRESVGKHVDSMRETLRTLVEGMKRIQTELRPAALDELGLPAALRSLVRDFAARTGVATTLEGEAAAARLRGELATAAFRIVQESLTNVARHASATNARVELAADEGTFSLRVSDDGCGLPGAEAKTESTFGILGIEERARSWGGRASVTSDPAGGTVVSLELPLRPTTDANS